MVESQIKKDFQRTQRANVRVGDKLAVRLSGVHARVNLREEFDKAKAMGDRPTFEAIYVRKNRRGEEVIERYHPDQSYEVQPNDGIPGRDMFRGDMICGQEITIVPANVAMPKDLIRTLPESTIEDEFNQRFTQKTLQEEL